MTYKRSRHRQSVSYLRHMDHWRCVAGLECARSIGMAALRLEILCRKTVTLTPLLLNLKLHTNW